MEAEAAEDMDPAQIEETLSKQADDGDGRPQAAEGTAERDSERCRLDLVAGLVRMDLLPRVRHILLNVHDAREVGGRVVSEFSHPSVVT